MTRKLEGQHRLRLVAAGYWISIIYFLVVSMSLISEDGLAENPVSFAVFTPMFLLMFFFSYLGLAKGDRDERLAKIAGRSMTISWCCTLLAAAAIIALSSALDIVLISRQVLGIMIIVMIATMTVSNEIMKRRGDVR
jgi:MFS family permease